MKGSLSYYCAEDEFHRERNSRGARVEKGYAPAAVIYTRSRSSRLKRVLREVLRCAELLILGKAVSGRERERERRCKSEEAEEGRRANGGRGDGAFPLPFSALTATSSSSRRPTNFPPSLRSIRTSLKSTPLNSKFLNSSQRRTIDNPSPLSSPLPYPGYSSHSSIRFRSRRNTPLLLQFQ